MSKYIGTPVVNISADTVDVTGDITTTDSTPEVIIVNDTHEDTDGGREGKVTFKGQQSGGEETTLAQIQASHDGASDDEKGDLIFKTNDGSDGASPTEAMRIDSSQNIITSKTVDINTASRTLPVLKFTHTNTGFDNFQIGGGTPGVSNAGFTIRDVDASANRLVINSDGNIGIGTSAPLRQLHINNTSANSEIAFTAATNGVSSILFGDGLTGTDVYRGYLQYNHSDDAMLLATAATERMRLNSNGAMFFCTDFNPTTAGVRLEIDGDSYFTADGSNGRALYLNRLTSDGTILEVAKDNTTVGSIGVQSLRPFFASADCGIKLTDVQLLPTNSSGANIDNTIDLGQGSARFDDIFATNGTINTSDANEKQDIASLTSAEITAATAISKLFKTYKWKDKVTEKGDNARTHTGVVAQQVQSAMSDAGLDVTKYAFWCSDTWWEKDVEVAAVEANEEKLIKAQDAYTRTDTYETKEEAPEGATERTRLGVRYPELLAFIGAATEQRLTSIESRLTALEGE